jgi:hypothetical protein
LLRWRRADRDSVGGGLGFEGGHHRRGEGGVLGRVRGPDPEALGLDVGQHQTERRGGGVVGFGATELEFSPHPVVLPEK